MSSQSFQRHRDIISISGCTVVVTVVDQHCCLPAVRAARCYRLVAAGENSHRTAAGSSRVQNLSQDLGFSFKWKIGLDHQHFVCIGAILSKEKLTKQSQQAHDSEDGLPDQLDVRRLGVVDLEASGQRALGEGVGMVAEEGVVVAQQGVVDGVVWICQEQILVLVYHLLEGGGQRIDEWGYLLCNIRNRISLFDQKRKNSLFIYNIYIINLKSTEPITKLKSPIHIT